MRIRAIAAVAVVGVAGAAVSLAVAGGAPVVVRAAPNATRGKTTLVTAAGMTLYHLTGESAAKFTCMGACAKAWPPLLTKAAPLAGPGVKSKLLGRTKRRDGTLQVTYNGRPLYYYIGDTKPWQILCQNASEFGGLWLVMRPSGKLVR